MVGRTFRGVFQMLGGLVAGLAILLLVLAWRLSAGPISLAFLSPYVAGALSAAIPGYRVSLDDTILTWAGWERALDIRVLNVRAVAAGDTVVAAVPELSLSLSAEGLMEGRIAPRRVELFRPDLRLVRHADGRFEIGFGAMDASPDAVLARRLTDLLHAPEADNPLAYLSRIDVVDADLTIEDRRLDTVWRAPRTGVKLRRDAAGMQGEITLQVAVAEARAELAAILDYRAAEGRLDLAIGFEGVNPARFARVTPALAALIGVDLALQGTVTLTMDEAGDVEVVGFDLSGGGGRLDTPASLALSLAVDRVEARGRYVGADERLEVDHLRVDLGETGVLYLPAPTDHAMPLRSLLARGRLLIEQRRLEVAALELDLHGPRAEIGLTVDRLGGAMEVRAKGTLFELPVDSFARYWPRAWGTDTQEWCVANLSGGMVRRAGASLALHVDQAGGVAVTALDGDMEVEGITVDYLTPMPVVRRAAATVRFDRTKFDIALSGGQALGLSLRKGHLLFTGLDARDQWAEVELYVDGPVRDALILIDSEPLGLAAALGIDPARTGGTAATRLDLRFLLERALTRDQVKIVVNSEMTEVSLADALLGRAIKGGRLDLQADNRGIDVTGLVVLGSVPAFLTWRENFSDDSPFRSRYRLSGKITEVGGLVELDLRSIGLPAESLQGEVGVDLGYTAFAGNRARLEARLDLSAADLAIPALGWSKDPGVAGRAEVHLHLQEGRVTDLPRIIIDAGDLQVAASAQYAADGSGLERIDFERLAWGRTDATGGLVARRDGGWEARLSGASLDLEPLWGDAVDFGGGEPGRQPGPAFRLEAKLDRVRLGPQRNLDGVAAVIVSDGLRWRQVDLEGRLGDDKRFTLAIRPGDGAVRSLAIHSDDAGAALRVFDYYPNMIGGTLDVVGEYDDSVPASPLAGRLAIRDYRVIGAPALAHLVSILGITGIPDALKGEGLGFVQLASRFRLEDGILDVTDARAAGRSLGFTAAGRIHTRDDTIKLEGTVVPAYLINAIWGRIPILGSLLTGGEEGGGVFAATYRAEGSIDDPEISVNPLTALAPGFLRKLFDVFGSGESTSEPPAKKDPGKTGKP